MPVLPRVPQVALRRPRLERLLDQGAPLTVLRGMAGYGKTVLLTCWLARQPATARVVFLAASDEAGPAADLRHGIGSVVPEIAVGETADDLALLDEAVRALPASDRLIVAIDDAHRLTDDDGIRRLVSLLHRHRRLHVVVAGRRRTRIADLAAGRIDVLEIPPNALLFSRREVEQLAGLVGSTLDEEGVTRAHRAFGGWPAPTLLALDAGEGDPDLERGVLYLRDSVLSEIDRTGAPDLVRHLALAGDLDEMLAARIDREGLGILDAMDLLVRSGEPDGRRVMLPEAVRAATLRAIAGEPEAATRRRHALLASLLESRLRLPTDERTALRAFGHAVDAGDWERAQRIWERYESRLSMHHPVEYGRVMERIPAEVLDDRPAWAVARQGMSVAVADLDDGEGLGTSIISAQLRASRAARLDPARLSLHDLLYLGSYRTAYLRTSSFRAAARYGDLVHAAVTARLDRGEHPGDRLGYFLVQQGFNKFIVGDDAAAIGLSLESSRLPPDATAPHHATQTAAALAMIFALHGEQKRARHWIGQTARHDVPGTWGHDILVAPAVLARGVLALDRLDDEGAEAVLAELGDPGRPQAIWPVIWRVHAEYALHFGDPDTALSLLERSRAWGDHALNREETANLLIPVARAELLVAQGRAQQALGELRRMDAERPVVAAAVALAELSTGQAAAARITVARTGGAALTPRLRLELSLIDTVAADLLGDEPTVRRRAPHIGRLVRATGALRSFARLPVDDVAAFARRLGVLSGDEVARLEGVAAAFPARQGRVELTSRERILVEALTRGWSRHETSTRLFVSLNTVKAQYRALYRKLGVGTASEALMAVELLGLGGDAPHSGDGLIPG